MAKHVCKPGCPACACKKKKTKKVASKRHTVKKAPAAPINVFFDQYRQPAIPHYTAISSTPGHLVDALLPRRVAEPRYRSVGTGPDALPVRRVMAPSPLHLPLQAQQQPTVEAAMSTAIAAKPVIRLSDVGREQKAESIRVGRGRPQGSKNKPKPASLAAAFDPHDEFSYSGQSLTGGAARALSTGDAAAIFKAAEESE